MHTPSTLFKKSEGVRLLILVNKGCEVRESEESSSLLKVEEYTNEAQFVLAYQTSCACISNWYMLIATALVPATSAAK
jgi:hypothetical protein